jgi:hypothetical protein
MGELPLAAALAPAAEGAPAAEAEVDLTGGLPPAREALSLDLVMSTAEGLAAPKSRGPDGLADERPPAATAPLVLSVRGSAFGSEAPSSTSGSIKSAEDNSSIGINPESEGPSEPDVLAPDEVVEFVEAGGGASPLMSSNAPCASKSSSESIGPFDGAVGGDAGLAAEEGRAPPTCDAVPFNPKGSSTGRSAKGSKAGREAASIIFEPESGRTILKRILQCRCRGTKALAHRSAGQPRVRDACHISRSDNERFHPSEQ